MAQVKICGINDPAALEAAAAAGADWVGFVFFPPSPRFVSPQKAAILTASRLGGPPRVGLFVAPDDAQIQAALDLIELDVLQVYAGRDRAAEIRHRFGRPVWRAVGIESAADLPEAEPVDAFLLDAKAPADSTRPGGNAARFDWSVLHDWRLAMPWLLAGGLTPDNVAQAIATSGTQAVDVSSGVERAPGVKDAGLIHRFVARAKQA